MNTHTDPICGMQVHNVQPLEATQFREAEYYFCSEGCRRAFDCQPAFFAELAMQDAAELASQWRQPV
jgi:YHS domain-containing protein